MKRSRNSRRTALAALLTGTMVLSATGCANSSGSRFASLNPFSKPQATQSQASPGVTESIADGSKSMWKRSTGAVTGMFAGNDKSKSKTPVDPNSDVDPLRLDHKAELTAEVLVANGRLWESTGNTQKAMENYTKALEKEPNDADALTNIARLHFRQGNHTQAADFFGRAIKESPKDAGLHNDLGLTLSKMGNQPAAQQMLTRALELAPGTSRYANNLASVKFESGDTAGALKVLEENNKPAVAHFNMAYLCNKNGRSAEAQQHLAQVMQFSSQSEQDASIKQAVDRSREMLAQIAGPQATIAQAQPTNVPESGIRQTSQSATADAKANVAPATGPAAVPSASTIKPSVGIEQVKAVTPQTTAAVTAPAPKVDPAAQQQPAADAGASADAFALPPGFQMPTN